MKLLPYKLAGATALAAVWVASAGASDGHGYRSSEHRADSGDKKGGYTKEVKQGHKQAEATSYKAVVPAPKHEFGKYEAPKVYEQKSAKPVYELKKHDEPKRVVVPEYKAPKVDLPKVEITVKVPNVSHFTAPKHDVVEAKKYEPKHDYDQGHDYGKGGSYEAPKHDYKPVGHSYKPVKHDDDGDKSKHVYGGSYQVAHTGNVVVRNYQPKHEYDKSHEYGYGKNDYRARDYAYAHRYDERDYHRGVYTSYHAPKPVYVHHASTNVRHDCDHAQAHKSEHHYGHVSHVNHVYVPVWHVVYQPVTVYVPVVHYQPVVHHTAYVHHTNYVNHYEHGYVHHASTHGYAHGKSAAWRVKAVFAARHAAHYASANRHGNCDRAHVHHVAKASYHATKSTHHVARAKDCGHVAKAKDCGHMAARTMVRHHA